MPTNNELGGVYLGTAMLHSKLSKARRKKVGAVLVTKNGVVLTGYNGTPAGLDNNCEYENYSLSNPNDFELVTKPEVIHAETNCILKAAREGVSCIDSVLYVTLQPCVACSAMMIQAGVKEVNYIEQYRDDRGIVLLHEAGIQVNQHKKGNLYNDLS
jgi:dCMP deaminase